MNIRKIIKEEMDEFAWAKQINVPPVYAVYYDQGMKPELEGYFTMEAFDRYLSERNLEREEMDEEPESKDEFKFVKITINW